MAVATTHATLAKLVARLGEDLSSEQRRLATERSELEGRARTETIDVGTVLLDLERRRALVADEERFDRQSALLLRICQPTWAAMTAARKERHGPPAFS